ncbi:type II toxin-antitoxin system Phd/YefM family antitoxin [Nitriliruptor alkaliphilus]|uniref:type II toxin-antitoxin system Phd/YefM family antitoxin n=1 Tax=Nitriliruptor alkaliphilus TaxID=427918 RepID=UPI0006974D26|nr:type II toxin-antitoxin system Phd/YefM family antitoxin [Nitriliruptor alkaliphilus]
MVEVGVHEAKTTLSKLLRQVAAGEEVIISRGGRPVARLVAIDHPGQRILGEDAGRYVVGEDFDRDLPDEVLDLFDA